MSDTREAFEHWFTNGIVGLVLSRAGDDYTLISAQTSWIAWQAATATEQERCALVCDAMKTVSGTDDVERGWNAAMRRVATAIRQGGAS